MGICLLGMKISAGELVTCNSLFGRVSSGEYIMSLGSGRLSKDPYILSSAARQGTENNGGGCVAVT